MAHGLNQEDFERLALQLAQLSPGERVQVLAMASGLPASEIWWANPEPPIEISSQALERLAEEMGHPGPPAPALVEAFRRWGPG